MSGYWMDWRGALADMDNLQRQVDAIFGDLAGVSPRRGGMNGGHGLRWLDRAEPWQLQLFRGEGGLAIVADVPGATHDDIEVTAENGVLTLKGQRGTELPEGFRAVTRELSSARFEQKLRLPRNVDLDAITAEVRDGVLTVRMPWRPEVGPRRVTVNAA